MKNQLIFLPIFIMLVIGCRNNGQRSDSTTAPAPVAKIETPAMRAIITDAEMATRKFNIDFTVTRWEVSADTLIVGVQYSGGCKTHDWRIYFSGAIMKSLPAQAMLQLAHINDDDDPCRTLIKDTLKFDLTSIRQGKDGKLVVKWGADSSKAATYAY